MFHFLNWTGLTELCLRYRCWFSLTEHWTIFWRFALFKYWNKKFSWGWISIRICICYSTNRVCKANIHIQRIRIYFRFVTSLQTEYSSSAITATTVRAVHANAEDRSKGRRKEFGTVQNSSRRLKWLQRPYGQCDRPRFSLKFSRSTVAVSVWDWSITQKLPFLSKWWLQPLPVSISRPYLTM